MEDNIQNNFKKSRMFSRQIYVVELRSSETFVFAVHNNFAHDSETYDFMKLYYDPTNLRHAGLLLILIAFILFFFTCYCVRIKLSFNLLYYN